MRVGSASASLRKHPPMQAPLSTRRITRSLATVAAASSHE
jgi:hypothetical protein